MRAPSTATLLKILRWADALENLDARFPMQTHRDWLIWSSLGWVTPTQAYPSYLTVPCFDGEAEVEIEIDAKSEVYRYASPETAALQVSRPLAEIELWKLNFEQILDFLSGSFGIQAGLDGRRCSAIVPERLWYFGGYKVVGSKVAVPLFYWRQPTALAQGLMEPLASNRWANHGLVLSAAESLPDDLALPNGHRLCRAAAVMADVDGRVHVDRDALDRLILGQAYQGQVVEPDQFFDPAHRRLKLPHFEVEMRLTEKQVQVIKIMWGKDEQAPPIMKWKDIQDIVDCGYRSLNDAFGGKDMCEKIFFRISHGVYQLRRDS